MLDGTHYFDCGCGSFEHTIRFSLNKEEGEIYTDVFLNQYRHFWKRVWIGIKYAFGYKCRYGHWDCWILDKSDVTRLRDMCDELINVSES